MAEKDIPFFARNEPHDQRVPILLTADEYLHARDVAADREMSISAYFRQLLNNDRRRSAQKQLSAITSPENSAEPAHDMNKFIKALAQLVKAEL